MMWSMELRPTCILTLTITFLHRMHVYVVLNFLTSHACYFLQRASRSVVPSVGVYVACKLFLRQVGSKAGFGRVRLGRLADRKPGCTQGVK
jgi:hypothetical protein